MDQLEECVIDLSDFRHQVMAVLTPEKFRRWLESRHIVGVVNIERFCPIAFYLMECFPEINLGVAVSDSFVRHLDEDMIVVCPSTIMLYVNDLLVDEIGDPPTWVSRFVCALDLKGGRQQVCRSSKALGILSVVEEIEKRSRQGPNPLKGDGLAVTR